MTEALNDLPQAGDRDLTLTRLIDAPRAAVYRAWTEPALLEQWFCPKPWQARVVAHDLRPGGVCHVDMHGPDGETHEHCGVYLEIVPQHKLVFTDAFTSAWRPSEKPFMTATITLADEAGGTRYTALVQHWSAEDREQHEAMGFQEGWGRCADQLAETARGL
jgi:uncharacterized protein YndB with AHSA1/START domain